MKKLSIDLETYSDRDLNVAGTYGYTDSAAFEILLFGMSVDDGPVVTYDVASGQDLPDEILRALSDPCVTKWVFHASFERVCLSVWLRRTHPAFFQGYSTAEDPCHMYLNPRGWKCSMIWCTYMGLPLSLASAGEVLGLDKQKMSEGKDLIRYFCMPCKPTRVNGGRTRNLPADAPAKWDIFKQYNVRDVETEMEIQKHLQNWPVPESVWKEYWIDQSINDRGIGIDDQLVDNAISISEKVTADLKVRMKEITSLENPSSVVQLTGWLEDHGAQASSLDKKHIAEMLKSADGQVKEILELRQMTSKRSIKKYTTMKNAECKDHRIRGMFQFYGASRSGRRAGRIVQLQNLARNSMPDLEQARELIRMDDYESLNMLYDNIPQVLSELIRTALVPRTDYKFVVADYSSVEARALAFMAGEQHTIDSFAKGEDIYCATASAMFGVPVVKHGINGELRQKGKIATLACGYGGSVGALKATGALDMGLREEELQGIVDKWRKANANIVQFWYDVEKVAKYCIRMHTTTEIHGFQFVYTAGMMLIELPSGRHLTYIHPRIDENRFGSESISYVGTGQTRKWERIETFGGKLVENITQAVCRDILAYAM